MVDLILSKLYDRHFMLACCAVWMSVGVFVMRKMINFDF